MKNICTFIFLILLLTSVTITFGQDSKVIISGNHSINLNPGLSIFGLNSGSQCYLTTYKNPVCNNHNLAFWPTDIALSWLNDQNEHLLIHSEEGDGWGKSDLYITGLNSNNPDEQKAFEEFFAQPFVVRIWHIQEFIQDFQSGTIQERDHPEIFSWPGRGNPHIKLSNGFHFPLLDMAPFYDHNEDGIYNPLDGDYPHIPNHTDESALPSFVSYALLSSDVKQSSSGDKLPDIRFHKTMYGVICDSTSYLNDAIFCELRLTNTRGVSLNNPKLGMHNELLMGCERIAMGTDTNQQAIYFYEKLNRDYINCVVRGLEDLSANVRYASSIVVLDPKINSSTSEALIHPSLGLENFYYVGLQTNPLYYGYRTQLADPSVPTNYLFFERPTKANSWSWPNSDLNYTYNRSLIGIDAQELTSDYSQSFHFAFVNHLTEETQYAYQEVDDLLDRVIPAIRTAYNSQFSTSICESPSFDCKVHPCLWPGDVNNDGRVYLDDMLQLMNAVVDTAYGKSRVYPSGEWRSFPYQSWKDRFFDINAAYYDCNGDGEILENDLEVAIKNFLKENDKAKPIQWKEPSPGSAFMALEEVLYLPEGQPTFLLPDLHMTIGAIGAALDTISQFCFRIELPEPLHRLNPNGIRLHNFQPKYLTIEENNSIIYGAYSLEKEEMWPKLDTLLRIRLSGFDYRKIEGYEKGDSIKIPIKLSHVRALNSKGDEVPLAIFDGSIETIMPFSTSSQDKLSYKVRLYPNPTKGRLRIDGSVEISNIQIFNAQSSKVFESNYPSLKTIDLDFTSFPSGIYYILIKGEEGISRMRFIVQ